MQSMQTETSMVDVMNDGPIIVHGIDSENDDEYGYEEIIEGKLSDPNVGMMFDTPEVLYDFWIRYGNERGFPVKKRSSAPGVDGQLKYVVFACSRSRKAKSSSSNAFKMQPTTKTECDVKIRATLGFDGKWKVTKVLLDHNHDLSPEKSRYYKRNRIMRPSVRRRLEVNVRAGIRLYKNYNSFVVEAGGPENVPFLEKDCRNYLEKIRRLKLADGDAAAIQNYFTTMQSNNSNFYSLFDLDNDGVIKNIFWADARSRAAYEEFGDAITFDTMYLTNKYEMPFAPFVGVNHHGQSILLGCALLCNKKTETSVWVFQTWLECMGGRAPVSIITDQDRAMQNAIEILLPDTQHRWCIWHIMKKLPEKVKHKKYESVKFAMQHAIYDSLSVDEFESSWNKFIKKYSLQGNDWLSHL